MMAQSLIACPLCSAASFSSTSALCLSLVNVASKWLRCTLCEEELHGLDKLTIHLLAHLMPTNNFQKHLTVHTDSPDLKQISHTEPLNLVKTQTSIFKETINKMSLSEQILNEPLTLQSKDFPGVECERTSLKIDDEVMIFFNNEDKSLKHKNMDEIDCLEKTCKKSSSAVYPESTVELNQGVEDHNNTISTTNVNSILSDEYFTMLQTNDSPHYLFPTNFSSNPYPGCLNKLVSNETDIDLTQSEKQKEERNEFIKTNKISDTLNNKSNEYALSKVTGNKSCFLSPRGERVLGYRCDVCSLVFPDEQILLMHRKLIHTELSEDSKEKKYKCHLCSKSFIMKGSLMVHMRVAHFGGAVVARLVEAKQLESNAVSPESAQYVCPVCNKGFTKEQQLTQHEKLHEGKQCDVCLKSFTTKYFLRKHKRLHTGEMPYSCSICNKSFTFQQSYHKHLLYHSDDKPYSCGECGRAFKELSTLHNHQRIHTGEKPFSCETCGKCFRQRVSYLVHRRIHTGVMPYKCQDCGKTFRYKVSERTHKCTSSAPGNSTEPPDISEPVSERTHKCTSSAPGNSTEPPDISEPVSERTHKCTSSAPGNSTEPPDISEPVSERTHKCTSSAPGNSTEPPDISEPVSERTHKCTSSAPGNSTEPPDISEPVSERTHKCTSSAPGNSTEPPDISEPVSERTHKCTSSAPGNSTEPPDISEPKKMDQDAAPNFIGEIKSQSTSEDTGMVEEHWHQKQGIGDHQRLSSEGEPADFFSLVMSPSERLQHLSLSADATGDHNNIDTESLKQLLYEVGDYN